MKSFLAIHGLKVSLGLACVVTGIFSAFFATDSLIPFADGQGYAVRAFALYGYLHTGQFAKFAQLFVSPNQSILPLHYLPFLLLPPAWAGVTSYAILLFASTYLLLAYALWELGKAFHRPEWAPGIFLFCAFNNVALTDAYAFYLDMPFLALGVLVLAWQVRAWESGSRLHGILAGAAAGLLFWVKPANALIFFTIYLISEAAFAAWKIRAASASGQGRVELKTLLRRAADKLIGFAPVCLAAFACGASQSIILLVNNNEVHPDQGPVECTGLLRLFYFPLCLSYHYHVILLAGILVLVLLAAAWRRSSRAAADFPAHLFLPIAFGYVIYGEFLSGFMLVKTMRAVLLLLPLGWIALGWLFERRRLAPEWLLAGAFLYATTAFAQKSANILHATCPLAEENYQLGKDSFVEMPAPWPRGTSLSQAICNAVCPLLQSGSILAVNSISMRDALFWRLEHQPLLRGEAPSHEVRIIFNHRSECYVDSLVGVDRILLVTFPYVQPSRATWIKSMSLLNYCQEQWVRKESGANLAVLPLRGDPPVGYEAAFRKPLSRTQVETALDTLGWTRTQPDDIGGQINQVLVKQFSWNEGCALLRAWAHKRLKSEPTFPTNPTILK